MAKAGRPGGGKKIFDKGSGSWLLALGIWPEEGFSRNEAKSTNNQWLADGFTDW